MYSVKGIDSRGTGIHPSPAFLLRYSSPVEANFNVPIFPETKIETEKKLIGMKQFQYQNGKLELNQSKIRVEKASRFAFFIIKGRSSNLLASVFLFVPIGAAE